MKKVEKEMLHGLYKELDGPDDEPISPGSDKTKGEIRRMATELVFILNHLDDETGKYFATLEVIRLQVGGFPTMLDFLNNLRERAEKLVRDNPGLSTDKLIQRCNLAKCVADFHQALVENYDEARRCYKRTNDHSAELIEAIDKHMKAAFTADRK